MQNEIQKLKDENGKLKKEIRSLKDKIDDLESKSDFYKKDPKINEIEERYKKIIEAKDQTIEILKSKLYDIQNSNLKVGEKFVVLNFKSDDGLITPIICKNKTVFKEVENQLYKEHPNYKNNKNHFKLGEFKIDKTNNSRELVEIGIQGYTIEIKKNWE